MFAVSISTCVLLGSFDLHILFLSYLVTLVSCNLFEAVIDGFMEACEKPLRGNHLCSLFFSFFCKIFAMSYKRLKDAAHAF